MAQVSRSSNSPTKPGKISKRLLTPCKQVGLSRKKKTPSVLSSSSLLLNESVNNDNPSEVSAEIVPNHKDKSDEKAAKLGGTSNKLLTPCRQVGLSRKRKTPSGLTPSLSSLDSPLAVSVSGQIHSDDQTRITPLSAKNVKDRGEATPVTCKDSVSNVNVNRKSARQSKKIVSRSLSLEDNETAKEVEEASKAESHLGEDQEINKEKVVDTGTTASKKNVRGSRSDKSALKNMGERKKRELLVRVEQTAISEDQCLTSVMKDDNAFTSLPDENLRSKNARKQKTNTPSSRDVKRSKRIKRVLPVEDEDEIIEKEDDTSDDVSFKPEKENQDPDDECLATEQNIVGVTTEEEILRISPELKRKTRKSKKITKNLSLKKLELAEDGSAEKLRAECDEEKLECKGFEAEVLAEYNIDSVASKNTAAAIPTIAASSDDEDEAFTSTPDEGGKFGKTKSATKKKVQKKNVSRGIQRNDRRRRVGRILSEDGSEHTKEEQMEIVKPKANKSNDDLPEKNFKNLETDTVNSSEALKDAPTIEEVQESPRSLENDNARRKAKRFKRILSLKKTESFNESTNKDTPEQMEQIPEIESSDNIAGCNEEAGADEASEMKSSNTQEDLDNFTVDSLVSKSIATDTGAVSTVPLTEDDTEAFTSTPEEGGAFAKADLINKIAELEGVVKKKKDELSRLKQAGIYRKKHNVEELKELCVVWKMGCIAALNDLLPLLQSHMPIDMPTLLRQLQIPSEVISMSPTGQLL